MEEKTNEMIEAIIEVQRFIVECEDYESIGWGQAAYALFIRKDVHDMNDNDLREYLKTRDFDAFKWWQEQFQLVHGCIIYGAPLWGVWRRKYLRSKLACAELELAHMSARVERLRMARLNVETEGLSLTSSADTNATVDEVLYEAD